MWAATGNDRDCKKAIALGFLYCNQSPGQQETADFDRPSVQEYTWLNGNP